MDNLMESNERTLVMFDSVCAGLAACLALVHNDIRQMTEHRNKLAQLEHDQIQAKLIPAQELAAEANQQHHHHHHQNYHNNHHHHHHHHSTAQKKNHPTGGGDENSNNSAELEDPHYLAGLKLLDKRLADSFSAALSLNDQHKSSITAKQHASHSKPTIFQVLLGKSHKSNNNNSHSETNQQKKKNNKAAAAAAAAGDDDSAKVVDNKAIIDDINRQTRLAMQYSKQLEANLFKLEDLRSKYEMHLKMGLVVKSVSRAYLATAGTTSSPNTLARRHHSSSLIVNNDSSSLGTQSSLSSLNLSTWSSSRSRAAAQRRRTSTSNDPRLGAAAFVSTLSLNGKQNKRLNKLISANEQNNIGNQNSDYAYNDWGTPDPRYSITTNNNNNNTLSKSNAHLNASSSSLKKAAKSGGAGPAASAASKTTIKEFIENIDRIEAEFESYMGSFLLAIEDIQGFARVCQGDVFEISIKYGDSQKFKTRISVLKDNRQRCDHRQAVFKARIADVLAIKAYECKGLGKRVLLGHKLCETRDLFTARSQLMTISLNQTGSIKLNLIVTWNPLHMAPNSSSALQGVDISHVSLPATPISSSTLSSLSSVPSLSGATTTIHIQSQQRNSNKIHHNHLNSPVPAQYLDPHETSMYQTVDPTYGYYVPPPDYITNNQ